VSNGTNSKEGEFDYLQGAPAQVGDFGNGGYNSASMNNQNDPYGMSSYYAPYMSFPNQGALNDGSAWSNGSEQNMTFLNYPVNNADYMPGGGMFGFDYGTQPGFGWGFHGSEYTAWGSTSGGAPAARKPDERGYAEGYYGMGAENYGAMNGEVERGDPGVKQLEQGLKAMNMNEKQEPHGSAGHKEPQGTTGTSSARSGSSDSHAPKKMTWASIASQPARPQPLLKTKSIPRAPVLPNKHNMDIGTWDKGGNAGKSGAGAQPRQAWTGAPRGRSAASGPYAGGNPASSNSTSSANAGGSAGPGPAGPIISNPVLDRLKSANQYNPKEFNINSKGARYFIIKSYSEDDIHRSIKYSIWCSTEHGNKRLDAAYREREGKGPVYFLFSVNGSGHFCGMAQMMSPVDYNASSGVWAQDKWKGQMEVKWIYVKDVPNSQLRHIRLENNENKPVTNSRDTQEVPPEKGKQVLRIIHQYRHSTSIFDDFNHYEKRQEEDPEPAPKGREAGDGRQERGAGQEQQPRQDRQGQDRRGARN